MVKKSAAGRTSSHISASVWSLAGFAVTVLAGIANNVVVENGFGRPALGLFSVCISIVIIGGQLGTAGQHNAALYFVSVAGSLGRSPLEAFGAALRTTFRTASMLGVLIALGTVAFPFPDSSLAYRTGILSVVGGVVLFSVNKVIVAYLNGMRFYRYTSVAGASRFVLILLWSLVFVNLTENWHLVPMAITCAEATLCFALVAANWLPVSQAVNWHRRTGQTFSSDIRTFGLRSLPAALFLDVNTRVDILVLSVLKGSDLVGQYTIASTMSEGLYQLCMSTRIVVEPRIAAMFAAGSVEDLRKLMKRHALLVYSIAVPVIGFSMAVFGPVSRLLYGASDTVGSQAVFIVLSMGILLAAGFIPFTNMFQLMGEPAAQSRFLIGISVLNLVANLVLVPKLSGVGSALGTALAQVVMVPLLLVGVTARLRIRNDS